MNASDKDEMMPPPRSHKVLTTAQRDLLGRWIAGGARYEQHWAFAPPRRPELPVVKKADWPRNPVDRFILARLEREALSPSPEAERTTLIRRFTLDLTGLPPTIAEVDAFLADSAPGAYERVVDRLMATRDYAERRAQDWLDRKTATCPPTSFSPPGRVTASRCSRVFGAMAFSIRAMRVCLSETVARPCFTSTIRRASPPPDAAANST